MHRLAVNFGAGYVAGLNAVVTGAMLAARQLGWTVVGIRDGFDGLMFPDRCAGGGLVGLDTMTENMDQDRGAVLGTASRTHPFHVRTVNAENMIEEVDASDELIKAANAHGIDAVISAVSLRAPSILFKLRLRRVVLNRFWDANRFQPFAALWPYVP